MKNLLIERTVYNNLNKQNDRVLKKKSINAANKALGQLKVLTLLNILVLQLPISNKLFNIINERKHIYDKPYFPNFAKRLA